jgi:hypothetical protein
MDEQNQTYGDGMNDPDHPGQPPSFPSAPPDEFDVLDAPITVAWFRGFAKKYTGSFIAIDSCIHLAFAVASVTASMIFCGLIRFLGLTGSTLNLFLILLAICGGSSILRPIFFLRAFDKYPTTKQIMKVYALIQTFSLAGLFMFAILMKQPDEGSMDPSGVLGWEYREVMYVFFMVAPIYFLWQLIMLALFDWRHILRTLRGRFGARMPSYFRV